VEEKRQLAAILFTDIAGYSALMARDEPQALACLARQRQCIQRLVPGHEGTLHKEIGDGTLSTFASARNAVECALALQEALAEGEASFRIRAAVHIGEVIFSGGDVYGDGVNIAARLEAIAKPGSVVVSDACFDALRSHPGLAFTRLGERRLKNIARPVVPYGVARSTSEGPATVVRRSMGMGRRTALLGGATATAITLLALWVGRKPASQATDDAPPGTAAARPVRLAMLPFANLTGDAEREFLSDGLTEEMIAQLGRLRPEQLRVIARTSSMQYKKSSKPPEQIGRELAVEYLLEGTVRQEGRRVRITAAASSSIRRPCARPRMPSRNVRARTS
jgi:class 3 adenylate cyclase/TolB-like protein